MPAPTVTTPNLLTDPGYLYWAPVGTALPANTVVGSVFTDAWPVAWIWLGMTDAGSDIHANLTVAPIMAEELIDPIAYRTTDRANSVTFALKHFTATNLSRTLNGGTSTVTGTTGTTLTQYDPPAPGTETRCMIGWESTDATVRWIGRQVINSGDISVQLRKGATNAALPWTANLEKPSSAQPFSWFFAGTARG